MRTLYVDNVNIEPPLHLTPPPLVPDSTPYPISFTVGGNWRIIEYGQNFGNTSWFPTGNGISKHVNFVSTYFDYFQRSGITVVRVFLLTDGRVMFDKDGHVIGYNEIFREDVQTFLDLADEHEIKVEFGIFDYLIAGKAEFVDGVWIRGRGEIITNESVKTEFINDFLIPFLTDFGDHPAIIGFDVINEPEWIISREDGGDWEGFNDLKIKPDMPIPGKKMKDFITDCINTIRRESPRKLITVGISCPYVAFVKDLDVDYIAIHHYPWMGELEDYLRLLPEGKQWALEEYPSHNTSIGVTEYLDLVLIEGGKGAMLWNLKPEIDDSTMRWEERNEVLLELRQWVDEHGPFDTDPIVSIATDKTCYTTDDTMTITIDIANPIEDSVRFHWYWGVLQYSSGSVLVNVSIKIFGDCLDAVFSPHGNVPFCSKAYSPDGKMYAHVNESTWYGEIGIFNCTTDELIKVIKVTPVPSATSPNPLKGLAWSPDSKWIAAMYHHRWPYGKGHISLADVEEGKEKELLKIEKEYHYMVFSADGTKIFASLDGSEIGFDVIEIK